MLSTQRPNRLFKNPQQNRKMTNGRKKTMVVRCDGNTPMKILTAMSICFLSFFYGTLMGVYKKSHDAASRCVTLSNDNGVVATPSKDYDSNNEERIESLVQKMVVAELKKHNINPSPRFPPVFSKAATGALRTPRSEFLELFDFGPPHSDDRGGINSKDVLILYSDPRALPSNDNADVGMYAGSKIKAVSAKEATENCDVLQVFAKNNDACLVMMDDYESGHVQLWRKLGADGRLNRSKPLKVVGRGQQDNGRNAYQSPFGGFIKENQQFLARVLTARGNALKELRPLAEKVAKNNTIIVLTCNHGQSALMINFICSSKSKGFDLSNILIFATDKETFDLAKSLGVEAYLNIELFGELPKREAYAYGDRIFSKMMFAKVICVQVINMLGYDVLFQDVDIVWYQNPLDTFHDPTNPYNSFDIVFQDDGAHSPRYTPYAANSGFYFVRSNDRTRYLFASFYYAGETILKSKSHQQALTLLLDEFASKFGLTVKTIPLTDLGYPGGWHFHRRKEVMKDIAQGKIIPQIFHMSWTNNKKDKLLYMRQMGWWHVNEVCVDKTVEGIAEGKNLDMTKNDYLVDLCCAKEPIISCHYRDKPSKIPCTDSPPIDRGKGSFW